MIEVEALRSGSHPVQQRRAQFSAKGHDPSRGLHSPHAHLTAQGPLIKLLQEILDSSFQVFSKALTSVVSSFSKSLIS